MADEILDKIQESALGPKRVRGDSGEVDQHPLKDLIEADKYERSKAAASGNSKKGWKLAKMIPPGAV